MAELHDIDGIVDRYINATHHTLIVAKKEYGQATHTIDGNEKGALFIAMDDIETIDSIHRRSQQKVLFLKVEQGVGTSKARYLCPTVLKRNAVCQTVSGK